MKNAASRTHWFVVAISCLLIGGCRSAKEDRLPNIVFILADDLGYGDLQCYNPLSKVPTPHIDRLAGEGRRFTDAHSPSGVCTPTRYGVLTGRYAWRSRLHSGVLWGFSPNLIDTSRTTVASLLQSHGYATAGIGKWHLGLGEAEQTDYSQPLRPGPIDHGFDYYFGIPASLDMEPYVFFENDHVIELPSDSIEGSTMRRDDGGGFWRAGPIAPSFRHIDVLPVLAEKAVEYFEQHHATHPDVPFFLYVPLSAPHTPWLPTEAFAGVSQAGPYGDFVAQVDWTVGQIIATLDRLKLNKETLLFVTSDNGAHWLQSDIDRYDHRANGMLRGQKADIWEGGHRVPFIVRWPGHIEAGTESDEITTHTDFLATIAAVIGAELKDGTAEDSYNILPALLGQPLDQPIREATVHHSSRGVFAIRRGPWKYIDGLGSGGFTEPIMIEPHPGAPAGQLYDLEEDLGERVNLYDEYPEIVSQLDGMLEAYKKQGFSKRSSR